MMKPFSKSEGSAFFLKTKDLFFLGSDAKKHQDFKNGDSKVEIYPGIWSTDPDFLHFVDLLIRRLQTELPESKILENGFYNQNAITSDFEQLRTVAGLAMTPSTVPIIDNTNWRSVNSLSNSFISSRDEELFEKVLSLRYSHTSGNPGRVSRVSSSVFPFFSKSLDIKVGHLKSVIKHFDRFEELILQGDLRTLYDEFKVIIASTDVYRKQVDSFSNGIPKSREVNDWEYAISGGLRGSRFNASKTAVVNGRVLRNNAAMRVRTAYGFSNLPNLVMTGAFEGLRDAADNRFAFTFKHRSRESILEKIKKFEYTLGVDVTQFDQSVPSFLMDRWIDLMPFSNFGKRLTRLMAYAPMLIRGTHPDDKQAWTGDPTKVEFFNQFRGLMSGTFFTSAFGKDSMTWAVSQVYDQFYGNTLEQLEKILLGQHDYAILNQSDDSAFLENNHEFIKWALDRSENSLFGLSPYFKMEKEEGFKYLGNVGYLDNEGEKKLCGDISTYLSGQLAPERGLNSRQKKFGVYGLLERRNVYSDHPLFSQVDEIFQRTFYEVFGYSWLDLLKEHLVMPTSEEAQVRSQADVEVLLEPGKLHYKYDKEDISPELLSILEANISDDDTLFLSSRILDSTRITKYERI